MQGFVLYCLCDVVYDGRAYSTLERGNYLIIYKPDGSLLIHGSSKSTPRNYQSVGSRVDLHLERNSDFGQHGTLVSRNNNEIITINIHNVIFIECLREWSDHDIIISKTEKELSDKLVINWSRYIKGDFVNIIREFKTPLGPVDVVGIEANNTHHVVEVKRRRASISGCTQLKRYVDSLSEQVPVLGYLASPSISATAAKYLEKLNFTWIEIGFD